MAIFTRICTECSCEIVYNNKETFRGAERDELLCNNCYKKYTKGSIGKYSKCCASCNKEIRYRRLGDFITANKKDVICQVCLNNKNSQLYKGSGLKQHLINKYGVEIGEQKFSRAEEKRKLSFRKYWEEHPEQLDTLIVKRTRSKIKIIAGLNCQGKSEQFYIEGLILFNSELPNKPKGIKTSFGYYFPDFEFEDRFIEIKSPYTYSLLEKENKKQLFKIIETAKTIKPVELIVIDSKGITIKTDFINGKCTVQWDS